MTKKKIPAWTVRIPDDGRGDDWQDKPAPPPPPGPVLAPRWCEPPPVPLTKRRRPRAAFRP